ncbi:MAG: DUF3574 domain-containing protein [Bryobacteraceae bacterium]|nr:DUF3574 domain-containing protein [Bryobacteraceae bacterium]
MGNIVRRSIVAVPSILCLLIALWAILPAVRGRAEHQEFRCADREAAYVRTTLYFGLDRLGGPVAEEEWTAFVRDNVTPRFPAGFTSWTASGQWRRADGTIAVERARVLLFVHTPTPEMRHTIRAIADRYKMQFHQESVLTETATVCAQF